jgi:hypothetical protein
VSADIIPASSLLPSAFGNRKPQNYWSESDVPEGGKERLYLTSEIYSGWKYYTMNRDVRLSKDYPTGWEDEIGYKFGHGPGKVDHKTGLPKMELSSPRGIWLARAWHVEREMMVAAIISSFTLQTQLQKILGNEEYGMLPSGICNFYLTIHNDKEPPTPRDKYMAEGALRICQNKQAIKAAGEPWWPEAYWKGLHPLENPAEQPPIDRLPATARDENGADHEASVEKDDANW